MMAKSGFVVAVLLSSSFLATLFKLNRHPNEIAIKPSVRRRLTDTERYAIHPLPTIGSMAQYLDPKNVEFKPPNNNLLLSDETPQHAPNVPQPPNQIKIHAVTGGYPRTATTFQFNVVCASLFLHIQTHRPDLLPHMSCTFSGDIVSRNDFQPEKPQVIKSHKVIGEDLDNDTTVVFTTAKTKAEAEDTRMALMNRGHDVGFIQDLETLAELEGEGTSRLYAEVYRLSEQQTVDLVKYFTRWDVLRTCCGKQMSKYWRNELFPMGKKRADLERHPSCGSYDINVVEREFMETSLYKALAGHELLKSMNKPSLVDGFLDGTYCSRYNDLVRREGVDFNEGNV